MGHQRGPEAQGHEPLATHRPAPLRRWFRHDTLVAVDLFSGFGGLTQGIELAGFDVITAARSYKRPMTIQEARLEITRCAVADSRLVVAGTIENRGNRKSDYRLILDVSGIGLRDRRVVITVDDVAPGVIQRFDTPIGELGLLSDADTPTCVVDEITGPLPFGLDIAPG